MASRLGSLCVCIYINNTERNLLPIIIHFFDYSYGLISKQESYMSSVYDNWERLVGATLKREQLREIALCPSFSSATSSDFSFDPSFEDVFAPSRLINPPYRGVRSMAFREIEKATENFRLDLYLGEGTVSIVYKGWIDEDTLTAANSRSGTAVAVKKWKLHGRLDFGRHMWLTEIKYLSQFDHPNVVKLIGYCSEGNNLLLVHELMCKGSLEDHLITRRHPPLTWDTRIKVAIDAARGLSFLHGREIPVIHGYIHITSILLDVDFNAKLSAFGSAMDGPAGDTSHGSTHVMGTYGFSATKHVATGHLMTKSDVFDFGKVLLEMLSGRELNGRYPQNEVLAVRSLAFQCLNSDPELRPRMDDVLVALQQL